MRRDVDRLRELGYPVRATKGPDGVYRLGAGIEEASLRAPATVRQVMPARLRHRIDALQVTAVPPEHEAPRVEADVLLDLGAAGRETQVLCFDYTAKDCAASLRRVEPHRLVSWGRRWYLVAWASSGRTGARSGPSG